MARMQDILAEEEASEQTPEDDVDVAHLLQNRKEHEHECNKKFTTGYLPRLCDYFKTQVTTISLGPDGGYKILLHSPIIETEKSWKELKILEAKHDFLVSGSIIDARKKTEEIVAPLHEQGVDSSNTTAYQE